MIAPSLTTLAQRELGVPVLVHIEATPIGERLRVDDHGDHWAEETITHARMLAHDRSVCDLRREVLAGLIEQMRVALRRPCSDEPTRGEP